MRTNAEFFAPAFAEFNNRAAIRFFERAGVKLEIERGERVFPKSGKAWDIATALLEYCFENGVKIIYNTRVTGIMTLGARSSASAISTSAVSNARRSARTSSSLREGFPIPRRVPRATDTPSHRLGALRRAGAPFADAARLVASADQIPRRPSAAQRPGDALDRRPAVREEFGELGFSQRGIEGAVALRMSRDAVDALIDQRRVKLVVDLKPALTEEVLRERIAREIADMEPTEFFTELLRKLVPKPLVLTLVHEMDVNGKNYVSKITEEQIGRLIKTLKGFTFPLTDYAPFEYAVVTAGGVCCDEVNPYTMESLKVRGLYFAGEVLDLDANTADTTCRSPFRQAVWRAC